MRKSILLVLLVLSLGIVLLVGIVLFVKKQNLPVLPVQIDITSITIKWCRYSKTYNEPAVELESFDVPKECWKDILDSLTPYEIDRNPAGWQVLGNMGIATKQGKTINLNLYSLKKDPVGAFSIPLDPSNTHRTYYRGGNSIHLQNAIVRAYEKSKSKHQ